MGRLFDAVAWLAGWRGRCGYEAQAAIWLEERAEVGLGEAAPYPLPLAVGALDWRPTLAAALADRRAGRAHLIPAAFHLALVEVMVALARAGGLPAVALCGGCFQNGVLLARGEAALSRAGFEVLIPRRIPSGDGGISLGQLWIARRS